MIEAWNYNIWQGKAQKPETSVNFVVTYPDQENYENCCGLCQLLDVKYLISIGQCISDPAFMHKY